MDALLSENFTSIKVCPNGHIEGEVRRGKAAASMGLPPLGRASCTAPGKGWLSQNLGGGYRGEGLSFASLFNPSREIS